MSIQLTQLRRPSEGRNIMLGFITERDLDQADEAFPGIRSFFDSLSRKPRTFLDLVSLFEHWCDREAAEPLRQAA
jgi:hypothetical protein